MPPEIDLHALASLLPGTWRIGATNLPVWLSGQRLFPTVEYTVKSPKPLRLSDLVAYTTAQGRQKRDFGRCRLRGGEFVGRAGRLGPIVRRWSIAGANADASIAVIRFSRTRSMPAGLDVIAREGEENADLRTAVASASERFGLTAEDFASLTWFDPPVHTASWRAPTH